MGQRSRSSARSPRLPSASLSHVRAHWRWRSMLCQVSFPSPKHSPTTRAESGRGKRAFVVLKRVDGLMGSCPGGGLGGVPGSGDVSWHSRDRGREQSLFPCTGNAQCGLPRQSPWDARRPSPAAAASAHTDVLQSLPRGLGSPPRLIFLVLSSSPVIAKHVTFKLSLAEKNVNLSKVHCSRMETLMWFYFKIL